LGNGVAIMEDQQVGNQMIIFDDLQLIFPHIVFNSIRTEIYPLGKVIEAFEFVLGSMNYPAEFIVTDIFQQK
jgi:hypothetical protein